MSEATFWRMEAERHTRAVRPWIVRHREGWCALPPGAEPDPEAWNDPTLCGYVVNMRGGSKRGMPDCPECLAKLNASPATPVPLAGEKE